MVFGLKRHCNRKNQSVLRSCFKIVAAEVTRRTVAHFGQEIRLLTSATAIPVGILKHALRSLATVEPNGSNDNQSFDNLLVIRGDVQEVQAIVDNAH